MIALSPVQTEQLYLVYQLLLQAEVPAPNAYVLSHFKATGLESSLQDELEEHFIENHGLDEETAKQSAEQVHVQDAVVKIPLSVDVLRSLLGVGLILDGDEGCVLLDNGETLPITLSREMRIRVTVAALEGLTLVSADTPIRDYFHHDGAHGVS